MNDKEMGAYIAINFFIILWALFKTFWLSKNGYSPEIVDRRYFSSLKTRTGIYVYHALRAGRSPPDYALRAAKHVDNFAILERKVRMNNTQEKKEWLDLIKIEERLKEFVSVIAGKPHPSPSLDDVCQYIFGILHRPSLAPAAHFSMETHQFTKNGKEYSYPNFILQPVTVKPKNIADKFIPPIVILAHYDTVPSTPGADDNTSCVATILAICELILEKNLLTKRNIMFVLSPNEEPPYFATKDMGSATFARDYKGKIKGAIVLEMIGYFSEKQSYPAEIPNDLRRDQGDFLAFVGKGKDDQFLDWVYKDFLSTNPNDFPFIKSPISVPLSDHISFHRNGSEAIMVTNTSFYRNDNYHKMSDTPETLNYRKMAQFVECLLAYIGAYLE